VAGGSIETLAGTITGTFRKKAAVDLRDKLTILSALGFLFIFELPLFVRRERWGPPSILSLVLLNLLNEVYLFTRRGSECPGGLTVVVRDGKITVADDVHSDQYITICKRIFGCAYSHNHDTVGQINID
jgi:hypothetical protein